MNIQFEIKPSRNITFLLLAVFVLAIFTVFQFAILLWVKIFLVITICSYGIWEIRKWKTSRYVLCFETQTQQWNVSLNQSEVRIINSLWPLYLSDRFVLLRLDLGGRNTACVLVLTDSLAKDKFLQLRRCILCPEVMS